MEKENKQMNKKKKKKKKGITAKFDGKWNDKEHKYWLLYWWKCEVVWVCVGGFAQCRIFMAGSGSFNLVLY